MKDIKRYAGRLSYTAESYSGCYDHGEWCKWSDVVELINTELTEREELEDLLTDTVAMLDRALVLLKV